ALVGDNLDELERGRSPRDRERAIRAHTPRRFLASALLTRRPRLRSSRLSRRTLTISRSPRMSSVSTMLSYDFPGNTSRTGWARRRACRVPCELLREIQERFARFGNRQFGQGESLMLRFSSVTRGAVGKV